MASSETPACTGRIMSVTVNAMSPSDAVMLITDLAGDIDFSYIAREEMDIEDIDEIAAGQWARAPQVPGGFEVRLLRVAYHSASGNETESSYHIEELSGPGPFHAAADFTSRHKDMQDIIRAQRDQGRLAAGTAQAAGGREAIRPSGPRL